MSDTMKIIFTIMLMIGVLIITLHIAAWKMKRASDSIIRDLEKKKAFDPASAVELPYCKESWLRFGLRDYRPKALAALLQNDTVRGVEGERYYLKEGYKQTLTGGGAAA